MKPSINRTGLVRAIRPTDFGTMGAHIPAESIDKLADEALAVAMTGFASLELVSIEVRGKTAYRVKSLPDLVVLRRLNSIVRTCARIRTSDRDMIIRQIKTILGEGVPHRVYKFDIKNFFETVDIGWLGQLITRDTKIPRGASLLLSQYFERVQHLGVVGIPRGISLSATLAEYVMQAFDGTISRLPEVYFYARYVDDIIIVTGAREIKPHFRNLIKKYLPPPLEFNFLKTAIADISVVKLKTRNAPTPAAFDYLGYSVTAHQFVEKNNKGRYRRKVDVSIAPKKIKKLKNRIACAFASFIIDKDFHVLCRRLQLLTGNHNTRDAVTGQPRNVGLYCNYRQATDFDGLKDIDRFFRSVIVGDKSRLAKRFSAVVTKEQRHMLLAFSFERSFKSKLFYNFRAEELINLSMCWRNA